MNHNIPTVRIGFDPATAGDFRILDLTVNPILFTKHHALRRFHRQHRRLFEVWIELVLGHEQSGEHDLPLVTFTFNHASRFTSDGPCYPDGPVSHRITYNYDLYKNIWMSEYDGGDLLLTAFGPKSERIVPPRFAGIGPHLRRDLDGLTIHEESSCKAALAFRRSDYNAKGRYTRVNYPCTYQATTSGDSRKGTASVKIAALQPFSLFNHQPIPVGVRITREESVSFWFHFPYREETASFANAPDSGVFAFIHRVVIDAPFLHRSGGLRPNYFPRIPFRYQVETSSPPLSASPRLESDPSCWTRRGYELMYPLTTYPQESNRTLSFSKRKPEISVFITVYDRRAQWERTFASILLGLCTAFAVNILSNNLSSEGGPSLFVMLTSVLFIAILVRFVYLILLPPAQNGALGRQGPAEGYFS